MSYTWCAGDTPQPDECGVHAPQNVGLHTSVRKTLTTDLNNGVLINNLTVLCNIKLEYINLPIGNDKKKYVGHILITKFKSVLFERPNVAIGLHSFSKCCKFDCQIN